ncbi:MAG TPA: hypothetical protein PLF01_02245 [Alphaproteobacteria bacterium]|nr:hypothetical protein [Alphaproteobacteria bacterium]
MIFTRLIVCLLVLVSLPLASSFAEEKAKTEETPITKWIAAENALLDSLPEQNQKVFFVLRNKHSVIRSIRVVDRDIKNAVKACGKANKDMKQPMNERFKSWEDSVLPVLKEAEKFLEVELKEQKAFYVSDYRHIIDLNDKAYKFSESKVQKTPVTTPEACQGLLDSMDRTEDDLLSLLQDILLPEEVVRTRVEQSQKAEDAAEEKSE